MTLLPCNFLKFLFVRMAVKLNPFVSNMDQALSSKGAQPLFQKSLFASQLAQSAGRRPATTSNPVFPLGLTPHGHFYHSHEETGPGRLRPEPRGDESGVNKRLVQGQGSSLLITPIQLWRQKLRASDTILWWSFVPLCFLQAHYLSKSQFPACMRSSNNLLDVNSFNLFDY